MAVHWRHWPMNADWRGSMVNPYWPWTALLRCGRGPGRARWMAVLWRLKAGRSDRIRGIRVKLCRGGGHEVAHSSELPQPHGSSTVTCSPYRSEEHTSEL